MISGKLDSPHDFGRYTLIAKVASGGMATVFRATAKPGDPLEGRNIAIKVLHGHLADNPEFIRMFKDEGRIVRDLDHPNVVHVFEVGECDGDHYLAMEFIDGRDLAQVLLAHRLNNVHVPAPVAFEILRQSLVALRYVHDYKGRNGRSLGIVHRDVSPQNLLISREPLIKLTDFGIARGDHRSDRTRTGTIKGKMHYMAPEQASGERVDARADLYAMGAVAYEMLTGQPLFGPGTTEVLHARAIRGDFDYGPKFERLPEDVKTWLKRALATAPEMRFQSADAMLAAMEQLQKASRAHYKPEVLVRLLDMEDARRSKQKEKNQRLILEDAAANGRLQPGAIMQAGSPPPKVVPTGQRVELDAGQRVSRLGHERGDSRVDWNGKRDVALRPATAVRELGQKSDRVSIRKDLLPAEAAVGKSYAPDNTANKAPAKAVKGAHVEALTPGSLASPRSFDAEIEIDAPPPAAAKVKVKAKKPTPVQDAPGLALASAVAWSCAALLLFAVTQELLGAQLKLPEAQDLRVASLWDDEPQPTRTDAVRRSPHAQPPQIDVAKPQLRKTALTEADAGSHPDVVAEALPVVPVRKVAGGVLPDKPVPPAEKAKEAAHAEAAVAHNAERVAWEGRPVEHVEKPGVPERGEKVVKPVTLAEAKSAVDAAAKLGYLVAGMPNVSNKPKRAAPADRAPVVVAQSPKQGVTAKEDAVIVPKPLQAKPVVAGAKPVVAGAKVAPAVAKAAPGVAKAAPGVAKGAQGLAKVALGVAKPAPVGAKAAPVAAKAPVAANKPVAKPVVAAKPVPGAKAPAPVVKPAVAAKAAVPANKPAVAAAKPLVAGKPSVGAKPAVPTVKPLVKPLVKPVAKPVVPAAKPAVGGKPAVKPAAANKPVAANKAPVVVAKPAPAVAKKPVAGQNH